MRHRTLALAALGAVTIAGCGTASRVDFHGKSRPAQAVDVSVYVGGGKVLLSPARVPAGLVTFNVTNQSGSPQNVRVAPNHSFPDNAVLRADSARTGRVAAGGTAQITASLAGGGYDYAVTAGRATTFLKVSRRPSQAGNSALLQP